MSTEISHEQQRSLVESIKSLIDENKDSLQVLERARSIASLVFGIMNNIDGDASSVGFNIQDYATNRLDALKGVEGAAEWAEESARQLDIAMRDKFGE